MFGTRDPRYTYPPVTAQFPPAWEYSYTGGTAPGAARDALYTWVASKCDQPKFVPACCTPGTKSTSSHMSWPTSPIQTLPVARSKLYRHGFRSPRAQIE